MEAVHERVGGGERIEFTRAPSVIHIILAVLPAAVAAQALLVMVLYSLPLPLIGLLLIVVGCCGALGVLVIDQLRPVTLTLADDGLHVERTWGSAVYPWHTVDGVKVVGATGTLGDDPTKSSSQRFGLGLFLKIPGADKSKTGGAEKDRETDENPDVILTTCLEPDTGSLIRMCEHINGFRSRLGGHRTPVKKFGGTPQKSGQLRAAKI